MAIDSLTPNDKGCQILMTDRLKKIVFEVYNLKFGEVDNFWAKRGNHSPTFTMHLEANHQLNVPRGPFLITSPK
jgi:succinyl-diaminopimelate desuccinylase